MSQYSQTDRELNTYMDEYERREQLQVEERLRREEEERERRDEEERSRRKEENKKRKEEEDEEEKRKSQEEENEKLIKKLRREEDLYTSDSSQKSSQWSSIFSCSAFSQDE